jgi:hypothetical protein
MKSIVSPLFLALVLAAPGAMAAEDLYRSTMPDGSVRYGEAPDPGAKSVKKVPAPPPATGVTVITPEEKARGFPPVQQGGTVVIPPSGGKPPPLPATGTFQAPSGVPTRSY